MGTTPVTGTQGQGGNNTPPRRNPQPGTGATDFEDTALADQRLAGVPQKAAPLHRTVDLAARGTNPFPLPYETIQWYHGTRDRVVAGLIRHTGRFNPDATGGYGKAYGPGTYFAPTEATARRYGEYVFCTELRDLTLLVVQQQGGTVVDHHDLSWLRTALSAGLRDSLAQAMRSNTTGNTWTAIARWARDNGFHGLHLKGIEEVEIVTVFTGVPCGVLTRITGE
ncbi:hypothetical protein ACWGB8_24455 [Kitasatospora sp. NPDC054939]